MNPADAEDPASDDPATLFEALRRNLLRQTAILNNIPDIAWLKDRESRFIAVNDAFGEACGVAPADLVGRTDHDIWPPELAAGYRADDAEVMRTGARKRVEERLVAADGRERWIETIKTPIRDERGEVIGTTGIARDVTERRRTQEALEQFQFMVGGSDEEIYLARADGSMVYVNEAAARSLGYTVEEMLALRLADIDPLNGPSLQSRFEELEPGSRARFETSHTARDGRQIRKEFKAVLLSIAGHDYVCAFGHDVTERVQTEERLRRVTRLYVLMSQISQAIVRAQDRDPLFQAICRVAVEAGRFRMAWIGLLDEKLGRVVPVVHAGHEDGYLDTINITTHGDAAGRGPTGSALRAGIMMICDDIATDPRMEPWREQALRRGYRSSAAIPFSLQGKVIGAFNLYAAEAGFFTDADRELLEEIGVDVSFALDAMEVERQRRQAEETLRQSEHLLSESQRIAHIGTWEVDPATGVIRWSAEMYRLFGLSPEDFAHTAEAFLQLIHPEDRAAMRARMAAVRRGEPRGDLEFRAILPDGTVRYLQGRGGPQSRFPGGPVRIVGTAQDISERHRAEQERLELERRLLHAQKLESLGLLAGGVAHDFNNLLMAMLGNLDLALQQTSALSPARANLEQSAQAARRATDLTRQMLAYSGKGRFLVRTMDLGELVEENAHLFRAAIARRGTLELRLERGLPPIEADAGQIQQVIMNLITNASEAIGERTGVIRLSTGVEDCDARRLGRSRLDVVPPPGRFVFLEVADNGVGMDEETQLRLFDPFFTTKATGHGLGMSAILGIVRGHRGAVLVDSEPGRGTSIRVLLPAVAGARAAAESAAGARAGRLTAAVPGGMVLVVDDEPDVLRVCRGMVEFLGLPALTAAGGREAIHLFQEHAGRIAVVILDLSMPAMDGPTTLAELRRIDPGVKVILSSGYDRLEVAPGGQGEGISGFVQKPYSLDQLRLALQDALEPGPESGGEP